MSADYRNMLPSELMLHYAALQTLINDPETRAPEYWADEMQKMRMEAKRRDGEAIRLNLVNPRQPDCVREAIEQIGGER